VKGGYERKKKTERGRDPVTGEATSGAMSGRAEGGGVSERSGLNRAKEKGPVTAWLKGECHPTDKNQITAVQKNRGWKAQV